MFGIKDDDDDIPTRKEALPSRMKLDQDCENIKYPCEAV